MSNDKIKLAGCECISQEDKETLDIMIYDAILRRKELSEAPNRKPISKTGDITLLKRYESFSDLVQNFKTCK